MIYATAYAWPDKEPRGPSVPAGFDTLEQVEQLMGEPLSKTDRMLIYGGGPERVCYSDFVFRIEGG